MRGRAAGLQTGAGGELGLLADHRFKRRVGLIVPAVSPDSLTVITPSWVTIDGADRSRRLATIENALEWAASITEEGLLGTCGSAQPTWPR